ncbi:MAG: hypothetical protein AAF670_12695 [Planctomycetota bacterium]
MTRPFTRWRHLLRHAMTELTSSIGSLARIGAIVVGSQLQVATVVAGFPELTDRVGRFCGYGWGDGYHACRSSGARPLANLPPRSYSARTGNFADRWFGCPQEPACGVPSCWSHVDFNAGIGISTGQTFYDRFDALAQQLRYEQLKSMSHPPLATTPILDPEAGMFPSTASRGPSNTWSELKSTGPSIVMPPAEASLTPDEVQQFREYQEFLEQKKRFGKYLVDPDEFEPAQSWGGPAVGTKERRAREEARIEQLRRARQRATDHDSVETSPSDLSDFDTDPNPESRWMPVAPSEPAPSTEDEAATSMEELLPPYPSLDRRRPRTRDSIQWESPAPKTPDTAPAVPEINDQTSTSRTSTMPSRRHFIRQPSSAGVPIQVATAPTQRRFIQQPKR